MLQIITYAQIVATQDKIYLLHFSDRRFWRKLYNKIICNISTINHWKILTYYNMLDWKFIHWCLSKIELKFVWTKSIHVKIYKECVTLLSTLVTKQNVSQIIRIHLSNIWIQKVINHKYQYIFTILKRNWKRIVKNV